MAYTTVNKSSSFMNTKLYTGNSSTQTISGVGFQPDFTWIKHRDGETAHMLFDVLRGPLYRIQSNSTNTSVSAANTLTSWNSDGFALGTENDVNGNSRLFASWNWKANGAGSANTTGSINSTVSVNTTAGFSICSYTGTGSNATVGHGLGSVPKMIITKALGATNSWGVYHASLGNNKYLYLDATQAALSATAMWNDTTPTSSVFSVGTSGASNASGAMIAYCFAEKQGYSKFGSYTGNGNADGTFIYTGFKPAFVMVKGYAGADDWIMMDNKRSGYNSENEYLDANNSSAESDGSGNIDFLSNGFKTRSTFSSLNYSGGTYIYMAFGQSLVGTNNIPNNAR